MRADKADYRLDMPDHKRAKTHYQRYRVHYEKALQRLHRKLDHLMTEQGINYSIKSRLKSFDSYFRKLLHLYKTCSPLITDLLGIRIISPFLEDLDRIKKILMDNFHVIEEENKGVRHSFREFGYDSVHLCIDLSKEFLPGSIPNTQKVCEVQLRTILQDAWAEVEHELIYKADFSFPDTSIKRKLASLNATLTLSDIIFQELRDYQKEIQFQEEKRRERLEEKVLSLSGISIVNGILEKEEPDNKALNGFTVKPNNQVERLLLEALNAHAINELKKAVEIYSRILGMKPSHQIRSIVYNHRGMAYFVQSEYRRCVHDFTRAIHYDPENFRAFTNRGLGYRMLQQYDKALEDFTKSLEIHFHQVEAYYSRALTYYELHDFVKAMDNCDRALDVKPDYVPAKHLKKVIGRKMFG